MVKKKSNISSTPFYNHKGFQYFINPSRSSSRSKELHKSGFTLAETLITLVIVGVVAALTVPTLIAKYQKEQTVTKLKKAYSTLSQAVLLSETENGVTANWDYTLGAEDFYKTYLKKYLIDVKSFGYINYNTLGVKYKFLNGNDITSGYGMYTRYRLTLNDGTILFIGDGNNNTYYSVEVDINGFKPPNKLGKDMFDFTIQKKLKVTPWGLGYSYHSFSSITNRNELKGNDDYACNKKKYGVWCTALIMGDGWKISDDYPW